MKLKKIIAVTLAAMLSVIPTERSIPEITASAKENSGGEVSVEEKAVTDMSEYETDEFLVVYQDGAGRKEKKEAVAGLDAQKTEVTDW